MRAFLIVLDSVGIGEAPDAEEYGDTGANTLAHTAAAVGGLDLPVMGGMGLGNIPSMLPGGLAIAGVRPTDSASSGFGAMREMSRGKDTTTGHWEMAGLQLAEGFHLFPPGPPSFPPALLRELETRTGRDVIGNKAASGTAIIDELGPKQMESGAWIAYTSADSVLQIAAHEEVIALDELYEGCGIARALCDEYFVGRVIARPYVGVPGSFKRTENRRDYSLPPPEFTLLDRLAETGVPVVTVGKLDDIFVGRGISEACHFENNADTERKVLDLLDHGEGLVFANLIDFDMLYGHRRDPAGYAGALESTDRFIGGCLERMRKDDLLVITADHGNDPTFKGTDHTREFVPLLVHQPGLPGRELGIRQGFYDVARSLSEWFGIEPMPLGRSFL